jgi:DNA replication initiation complex subunit (GINS family)
MITYNDLYEALRKERYSEQLQPLLKDFIKEVAGYINEKEALNSSNGKNGSLFSEEGNKSKKQLENAISMFKELLLRRKKKLLDLAFVSAETGISKRDFENMLLPEKETFEKIMKAINEGDKEIEKTLSGEEKSEGTKNKLIIFKQDTEDFLDFEGNKVGPFKKGDIVNLPMEIANILIVDNKADPIEES